jgi:hypothetical protein
MRWVGVSRTVFVRRGNKEKKTFARVRGISARHLYERSQIFLQSDPVLQHMANVFTPEIFTVEGIEVLGTPIGTEGYIKNFVSQNCVKIMRDIEKLEPLTDGLTHFQLIQKTQNTRTQYTSANITLPQQEHFLSAQ